MDLPKPDGVAGGVEDRPWQSYHTVYTNAKAGMDGVNKEKVQRIVYEMSKGSKYFENEQRKEAYIQKRIENLRCQAALLTASDIAHFEKVADRRVLELEASRDVSRIWVHVDMDAFYAAVETLENPSLAGKPMAVGNMSMICTANYEARKFGIRAAMPGFIARKLYPDLIFVPTNFEKYSHYSELTRQVFREYDSRFIARSLDEAYLDVTDVCRQRCINGEKVAEELREHIYIRTGLTCSAGVAPNRLLAKVCSDINKPNGQFVLPNERAAVITFVSSLPIRKVSGIGKVTEHMLKDALGINTCEDLLHKRALVCALFSRCSTDFFLSVGLGLGGSEVPQEEHRKSISSERTFPATNNEVDLFKKLEDIADTLSTDMEKEGLRGRTLTLKLKTAAFEVRTRAISLQLYIHLRADILHHASKLLKAELPLSLRLMGLRISQFKDDRSGLSDPAQKTLTSYVNMGNITREIGSPERHLDAQNDVCYFGEIDGRNTNNFSILENEMSPADVGSWANLVEDSHLHQHGSLPYVNIELLGTTPDQSECKSINFGTNEKSSCTNSVCVLEMFQGTLKNFEFNLENDNDHIQNESLTKMSEIEQHGICSASDMIKAKADSQSGFSNVMFWKDDYCCSLCGAELPSSFIQERQEHSDYHLARMLQEEESPSMNAEEESRQQRKRLRWSAEKPYHGKRHVGSKSADSKKRKHLPIDAFFSKGAHHL